jgi:D-glycero-alpha-D-manno-heptose 1-phosphate guanylyltransferase
MEAIVLAGGRGTRLGELTKDLPKPMISVRGRPFLEYLLEYWRKQGVGHFVLGVGYHREVIRDHFKNSFQDIPISYSIEENLLGTGGGLLIALGCLEKRGPFLVINGDTFFEVDLAALKKFHRTHKADITFSLMGITAPDRFEGLKLDDDGRIAQMVGRHETAACRFANGGVYLMERTLFDGLPFEQGRSYSLENDIFRYCLDNKRRLYGCRSEGRFIDIGTPEDYKKSQNFFKGGDVFAGNKQPH